MNIEEIREFLEVNANKKVSTINAELIELIISTIKKSRTKPQPTVKIKDNKIVARMCYYHKKFEPIEEFGPKSSDPYGYNTMCRKGNTAWHKQYKQLKDTKNAILTEVLAGNITNEEGKIRLARAEEIRQEIHEHDVPEYKE